MGGCFKSPGAEGIPAGGDAPHAHGHDAMDSEGARGWRVDGSRKNGRRLASVGSGTVARGLFHHSTGWGSLSVVGTNG